MSYVFNVIYQTGYKTWQRSLPSTTYTSQQDMALRLMEYPINSQDMKKYFIKEDNRHIQLFFIEFLENKSSLVNWWWWISVHIIIILCWKECNAGAPVFVNMTLSWGLYVRTFGLFNMEYLQHNYKQGLYSTAVCQLIINHILTSVKCLS